MRFSSFKGTKLIFENFRKFTNEAEGDEIHFDDDDTDIDIPGSTTQPRRTQAQHTAAAADAETERVQKAAEVAARRSALAKQSQADMDVAFPEDPGADIPGQQTASPQQRAQRAYLNARRGGAGDESSGIVRAMADLQGDQEALNVFKSMVSGDETSGYSFVRKAKPQDRSGAQPRGTYGR